MTQPTLQITLQATGENSYIMKYPETVNVKLELARSSDFWGVFLSVVETFQAIKEDREYLLDAFDQWEAQGYTDEYQIQIDIAVNEYDQYNTIYTGFAIPGFEDDTYYFKCKFQENNLVQKFLDGNIDVEIDMETDGEHLGFLGSLKNKALDIISGYNENTWVLFNQIDLSDYVTDEYILNVINAHPGTAETSNKYFATGNDNESLLDYVKSPETDKVTQKLFNGNDLILGKRTDLIITLRIGQYLPGSDVFSNTGIVPFGARESSGDLWLPENFSLRYYIDGERYEPTDKILFEYSLVNANFNVDENNKATYINHNKFSTSFLNISGFVFDGNADPLINNKITYPFLGGIFEYKNEIQIRHFTKYPGLNGIYLKDILSAYFGVSGADNTGWISTYYTMAFLPIDGAFPDESTLKFSINITDLVKEISKALSVGVKVGAAGNLVLTYIPGLFSNDESVYIDENNVFEFSTSLNEGLKIGSLSLGTTDKNYDYYITEYDQTRKTIYNARNAFSGNLDLSLSRYKCQALDFVDSLRDDIFQLYEEDKNADNFTLYSERGVNEAPGRFEVINSAFTAPSQIAAWSWLLQVISPNGFTSQSEANQIEAFNPLNVNETVNLTKDIEPTNTAFTYKNPVITLRKYNAKVKLTTEQYNAIVNDREGFITVNYKGVEHKGYVNILSLDIGKNMLCDLELLERYENDTL